MRCIFWLLALFTTQVTAAPVTFSGYATATSDYRYNSISYSNGDPAVQGSIEAALPKGVYAGVWASSVHSAQTDGGAAEVDVYTGVRRTHGLFTYDLGGEYFSYAGARRSLTGEGAFMVTTSIAATFATTSAKIGLNYTPRQESRLRNGLYGYIELAQPIPRRPITLKAHLGHTSNAATRGNYLDYSVGGDYTRHKVTLNVSYVGTNISCTRAGPRCGDVRGKLIGAVSYNF